MARGSRRTIIEPRTGPIEFPTESDGSIVVDPGDIDRAYDAGSPADGSDTGNGGTNGGGRGSNQPRRRGRSPDGGSTTGAKKKASLDVSTFSGLLVGFHAIIATKAPEMTMDQDDADQITKAANNVLRHYNVKAAQKTIDIAGFVAIAGAFYVPRIIAMNQRLAEAKQQKPPPVQPRQDLPAAPKPSENRTGPRLTNPIGYDTDGEPIYGIDTTARH